MNKLILLLVVILSIIGCSDNDNTNNQTKDNKLIYLPIKEYITINGVPWSKPVISEYNTNNKIIKNSYWGDENNVPEYKYFTYNDKKQLIAIDYQFGAAGTKIFRYEFAYNEQDKLMTGNRMVYINNAIIENLNYTYTLSTDGKVVKIDASGTETYVVDVNYDPNGNIIKVEKKVNNIVIETSIGTYGDKNSPYKYAWLPFYVDDKLQGLLLYAKNNLLTQERENQTSTTTWNWEHSNYNDKNHPMKTVCTITTYNKINNTNTVVVQANETIYEKRIVN